jgi:hypothetical protein
MFRWVAGRPVLRCVDRTAQRRRTMSRCQRTIVSGVIRSRSHEATRVIRRKANRRHMTGDHHGRTLGEQLYWSEPWMRFSAPTGARPCRPRGRSLGKRFSRRGNSFSAPRVNDISPTVGDSTKGEIVNHAHNTHAHHHIASRSSRRCHAWHAAAQHSGRRPPWPGRTGADKTGQCPHPASPGGTSPRRRSCGRVRARRPAGH